MPNDADDATRLAIELRLRLTQTGPAVDDETASVLRRCVGRYVGALKALKLGQNDVCAALRAVFHEARKAQKGPEDSRSKTPHQPLHAQLLAWGTEAYSMSDATD